MLTIFTGPQPASWQLEEGCTQLQQQDMGMIVLIHQQNPIDTPPDPFSTVPVSSISICQ